MTIVNPTASFVETSQSCPFITRVDCSQSCYCRHYAAICDPLRDNPAHPTKIVYLLEVIIVTKATFQRNVITAAMGQQTVHKLVYESYVLLHAQNNLFTIKRCHFKLPCSFLLHFTPSHLDFKRISRK